MKHVSKAAVLAGLLLTIIAPAPAKADRIDGDWCKGLRHLSIDGPNIVTPGGTRMTGDYNRHGFRYVVPEGEADAGATITIAQMHEELMHLISSSKPDEVEAWTRCNRLTS